MLSYAAARARRKYLAALIASCLIAAGLAAVAHPVVARADTSPPAGTPATVTATALPTVQVLAGAAKSDVGVVWSQVLVGDTVYAAGSFSETYPAGESPSSSNETPRSNLLAYNITTGALDTSFTYGLNAQGLGITVSPNKKTLYVVGSFTAVTNAAGKGLATRQHIAAFDLSTGKLITSFAPKISSATHAVVATNSTVYAGGTFTSVGGVARTHLAAFEASTGHLLTWAPSASAEVDALAISPDGKRVIIGGKFATVNSTTVNGLTAVNPSTGSVYAFAINQIVQAAPNNSAKCGITSLTTNGNAVFGTAFAYGCGNFEGRFSADPDNGKVNWIDDCHGDSYGTVPVGGVLYSVSHAHDCSAIGSFPNNSAPGYNQRALAETVAPSGSTNTGPDAYKWDYSGQPDSSILQWFPKLAPGVVTGQDQAGWSIVGNSKYVAIGGEFPTVNGFAQAGLVRFALNSVSPDKEGPIPAKGLTPTVTSTSPGTASLSWTATWDEDNADLAYSVVRFPAGSTTGTVVATLHQTSNFWTLPTLTYTDTSLSAGGDFYYRIRVSDPNGNTTASTNSNTVTVAAGAGSPGGSGPQASFTTTCDHLACTADGSASSDSSGTLKSYTWDFGDGTHETTTGPKVDHTYAAAGTYTITLTVSDGTDQNAVSSQVTATKALPSTSLVLAVDTFAHAQKSGWGRADKGGTWQSSAGCGHLSVAHRSGYLISKRGVGCQVRLVGETAESSDTTATLTTTRVPKGGMSATVVGRRVSAQDNISLRLHLLSGGKVAVQLVDVVNGRQHAVSKQVTLNLHYAAQKPIHTRLIIGATAQTVVSAKVWTGSKSPNYATVHGAVTSAALRKPGGLAFVTYLPRSKNPPSITARLSSVEVKSS